MRERKGEREKERDTDHMHNPHSRLIIPLLNLNQMPDLRILEKPQCLLNIRVLVSMFECGFKASGMIVYLTGFVCCVCQVGQVEITHFLLVENLSIVYYYSLLFQNEEYY